MKLLIFLFLLVFQNHASANWYSELFTGDAYSVPSKVTVRQNGYPEASKTAKFSTRPTEPAPYYSFRIGFWQDDKSGLDVEMLHHKLYMDNTDEIFNEYKSTFGFNLFLLNKGFRISPSFVFRLGIGPVVSHPINTIRGQTYTDDVVYKLVGLGSQASLQFKQRLFNNLYLTEEIKTTYAVANLPIANGDSSLSNLAFHGLIGFGYDF